MQLSSGREWGGGVAILDVMPEPHVLRAAVERAVERWPRLRESSPARSFAIGAARGARRFDLDHHLRWESRAAEDDLVALMTERFFQPLDEGRPPWELHVLAGPERALLLVKMGRRLAPGRDPAPLLSALVTGTKPDGRATAKQAVSSSEAAARARDGETEPGERPSGVVGLGTIADGLSGLMRMIEGSQSALRESAALLAAIGRAPPRAEDLKAVARRATGALTSLLSAPIANPLPATLLEGLTGTLRLALVDLPSAALDAARAPFGLEIDDVLVSIGAATMSRLEGRGSRRRKVRALVAAPRRSRVVLSETSDPLEGAREVRRALSRPSASRGARALPEWRGDIAATLADMPNGEPRPYDLSVCYDRSPLAGQRLAGSELVRVYPIDATPRGARLAIGAQRCGDDLSLGLTFSTAVAREPGQVLEAFEIASAEFVDAARASRPPSARMH